MLFLFKEKIRNLIIFLFMANRKDLAKSARVGFAPEKYTKKHIANSSIITMYQNSNHTLFFRECRSHQKLRRYLVEHIEEYFDIICKAENREWLKESVKGDLSKKENYKKALRITSIFNYHLLEILSGEYCDYSATGFDSFAKHKNNDDFIAFIQYFSCVLISHQVNSYVSVGQYENFNANKQLATYQFARVLGIDHMIPPVWVCCFTDGEKKRVGTMMDKAEGMPPSDILPVDRKNFEKSTFLKDITTLEYFDALCYQLDHRLDNYYVTRNEVGKIDHVVAFDNDAARTFFVTPSLPPKTYADANCVLAKDKTVARPYMDKAFAEKLFNLSEKDVKVAVGEYLSCFQLFCLNQRINTLKQAIRNTVKQREDFLVSDWDTVDMQNATGEQWGKTYLELYFNDTLMLDRKKQFEEMKNKR